MPSSSVFSVLCTVWLLLGVTFAANNTCTCDGSSGSTTTVNGKCDTPNQLQCIDGGDAYTVCGSGYWQPQQPVAAGMTCVDGELVSAATISSATKAKAAQEVVENVQGMADVFKAMMDGTFKLESDTVLIAGPNLNITLTVDGALDTNAKRDENGLEKRGVCGFYLYVLGAPPVYIRTC